MKRVGAFNEVKTAHDRLGTAMMYLSRVTNRQRTDLHDARVALRAARDCIDKAEQMLGAK